MAMSVSLFRSFATLGLFVALEMPVQAAIVTFNSDLPANNAARRSEWLAAIGIAAPENLVDFESGFVNNQNISGVGGLFPDGLVITDTGPGTASAIIVTTSAQLGGSNPVGSFAVGQDEQPYLELNFSASPVDYVGFQDIDHAGTTGIVTFVGGATAIISLDTTGAAGNTAEFYGIFRNDMPKITLVQLDASGDAEWGIDNIEYGVVQQQNVIPEPSTAVSFGLGIAVLIGGGWLRRKRTSAGWHGLQCATGAASARSSGPGRDH
jgi:hypothetical protein